MLSVRCGSTICQEILYTHGKPRGKKTRVYSLYEGVQLQVSEYLRCKNTLKYRKTTIFY